MKHATLSGGTPASQPKTKKLEPADKFVSTKLPNPGSHVSFSGADIRAIIQIPNDVGINLSHTADERNDQIKNSVIALQGLQTLSISIYRDKSPVRALGFVNPIGNTRGGRTIAGSMIFAILKEHPLWELNGRYIYDYNNEFGYGWRQGQGHQFFPDAAPPFNLHMIFSNETGNRGLISLFGVEFTNDGTVASIEDMLTENTYQWIARDMKVFQNVEEEFATGTWKGGEFSSVDPWIRDGTGKAVTDAFERVGVFGDAELAEGISLLTDAAALALEEQASWGPDGGGDTSGNTPMGPPQGGRARRTSSIPQDDTKTASGGAVADEAFVAASDVIKQGSPGAPNHQEGEGTGSTDTTAVEYEDGVATNLDVLRTPTEGAGISSDDPGGLGPVIIVDTNADGVMEQNNLDDARDSLESTRLAVAYSWGLENNDSAVVMVVNDVSWNPAENVWEYSWTAVYDPDGSFQAGVDELRQGAQNTPYHNPDIEYTNQLQTDTTASFTTASYPGELSTGQEQDHVLEPRSSNETWTEYEIEARQSAANAFAAQYGWPYTYLSTSSISVIPIEASQPGYSGPVSIVYSFRMSGTEIRELELMVPIP